MSDHPPALLLLGEGSMPVARLVRDALPGAAIHGLAGHVSDVDAHFERVGPAIRRLFEDGIPIVAFCAAGIVIRALALALGTQRAEPPVVAVAEDGSAVVPLLGGLRGVNDMARTIGRAVGTRPAITITGEERFDETLAPDRPGRAHGRLAVVGLGPGTRDWLAPEARRELAGATDVVGYGPYVETAGPFAEGQTIHVSDNRGEMKRARHALALAATGRSVAVVSSGDPGVFAMAAAVMEALHLSSDPAWHAVELAVVPGISAAHAAAARAGAPLGHDFCVLSLSDNLKPWEIIERRLDCAVAADLVLALYNPASRARPWQFERAAEVVARHRSPETPVVIARDVGRPGEMVRIARLGELPRTDIDMRTIVIIGSSTTRIFPRRDGGCWVYTPRWYGGRPDSDRG